MEYTLTEAAEACGKDRTTLFRAIKKGRLSARQEAGTYIIDAAELHRVYPLNVAQGDAPEAASNAVQHRARPAQSGVEAELRERIALLERTVEDLRARLDRAEAEASDARSKALDSLTAMLPRLLSPPAAEPAVTPPPRRRWWLL